jgi:ribosome-associated toxin RatA of RatAB toxin-antitoxin module
MTEDRVTVRTTVHAPPERVYEFLLDFEGYGRFSEYVEHVHARGDGGVGTEYSIRFAWWKLSYTAKSRVTELHPPERIDWRIIKDIEATGAWRIEELDADERPDGVEDACDVIIDVTFDPDSVGSDALSLPRFVSISWVIEKVVPLIEKQARNVLRRVVTELEGEPRDLELEVQRAPTSVDVDEDDLSMR